MNHEVFLPKPEVITRLKTLVSQKKKEQALKAAPVIKEPIVHGPKIGRNDPCHCGSGQKFKKCCLLKEVRE